MQKFMCPVCGYVGLNENSVKQTYEICSCCFTEFGNDDSIFSHEELRISWIENGMLWGNGYKGRTKKPIKWNPVNQLESAGFLTHIKIICKHCGKNRYDHFLPDYSCPIGKKHRTYGYTQCSAITVFEPKIVKLRKPREAKKFSL